MKMTKSPVRGYENMESWMINSRHGDDTESGDEEALSLCDLPITINHSDEDQTLRPEILKREEEKGAQAVKIAAEPEPDEEEFNFGSSKGNLEPEMCAADEVFLCGQILPFRHSISSSDTGRLSCPSRRILSRSGSMDHYVSAAAATTTASSSTRSSRSSSTRSYSSSSSSANHICNNISSFSHHHHHHSQQQKAKVRNNFQYYSYQHPSPKPQVRTSGTRRSSISGGPTSGRKSGSTASMWEFLRLGLIRTPNEIALEDLKVRSRNSAVMNSNKTSAFNDLSRNSSSGSCSSSSGSSVKGIHNVGEIKTKRGQKGLDLSYKQTNCMNLKKNGGIFSGGGCKCSVGEEVVEPSPRVIVVKGNSCVGGEQKTMKHMTGGNGKKNIEINVEDKELLLQKKQEEQQGKHGRQKAMSSRHRMSEWLKELTVVTHAGHVLNEF